MLKGRVCRPERVLTHSIAHKQHILVKSNIAALVFILFATVVLSLITSQHVQYQLTAKKYMLKPPSAVSVIWRKLRCKCCRLQINPAYLARMNITSDILPFCHLKTIMPLVLLPEADFMLTLKILYQEINWNQHLDFQLQ
jgi:hypothetical protein